MEIYTVRFSCRCGACSLAFKCNVLSELIKFHGDWLGSAYLEYLTYDFDQLLSVLDHMTAGVTV